MYVTYFSVAFVRMAAVPFSLFETITAKLLVPSCSVSACSLFADSSDVESDVHMLDLTQPVECMESSIGVVPVVSEHAENAYARLETMSKYVDHYLMVDGRVVCGRGTVGVDCRMSRIERENPTWNNIISKQHFIIERDFLQKKSYITDISTNGTFVNGNRLLKDDKVLLNCSDTISVGLQEHYAYVYNEELHSHYPAELTDKYFMTSITLGKGGYGKVYLARVRSDPGFSVAVKVLGKSLLSRRFSRAVSKADDIKNEVEIMLRLDHPNIVRFEDWVQTPSAAYIVLEYVGGGELFDRITRPGWKARGVGEELGLFYAYQLLSAVAYLHENGICHRDIKPENILLFTKEDFTVCKLTDFGLAKPREASTMKTFCGTPCYIAPEMLDNERAPYVDKVDIWSLGVVFFTMFVGYPPFSADYHDMSLNDQIRKGRLLFMKHWKVVSADTQTALKKMLRVETNKRLTARELLSLSWMKGVEALRARDVVSSFRAKQRTHLLSRITPVSDG